MDYKAEYTAIDYSYIHTSEGILRDKMRGICQYIPMAEIFRSYSCPVRVNRIVYTEPYSKELHMHDMPQIWYCRRGSYTHTVDGKDYICREGSLLTVPPGSSHCYQTEGEEVELIFLENTFYFLKRLPPEVFTTVVVHQFCYSFGDRLRFSPQLFHQLEGLERERVENIFFALCRYDYKKHPPVGEILKRISELYALNIFVLEPREAAAGNKVIESKVAPLFEAALYCNKNYLYSIDSNMLCKISNMSRASFFTAFKKLFGVTYLKYLHTLRMYRVKLLLEFSGFSLSYIADKLNFTDTAYLSNCFKRYFGLTPLQFRKLGDERRPLQPTLKTQHFDNSFWESINIE